MKKNIAHRVIAATAVTGAAVMGLTSLGAGGAHAGQLPTTVVNKKLVDKTNVNVKLFDQFVNVQRAVTNVQTSREAWVSGKVRVTVDGSAKGAVVKAGYLVGCQVTFTSGANGNGGVSRAPGSTQTVDPTTGVISSTQTAPSNSYGAGGGASVTLGPGQVGTLWIISTTSGDNTDYKNYNVSDYTFTGPTGGVAYSQEKLGVDGCAGYAEAKAIVQVTVDTDSVKGVVTLYGPSFSLG